MCTGERSRRSHHPWPKSPRCKLLKKGQRQFACQSKIPLETFAAHKPDREILFLPFPFPIESNGNDFGNDLNTSRLATARWYEIKEQRLIDVNYIDC
jgi:hypothetical protein